MIAAPQRMRLARASGIALKIVDELCAFRRAGDGRATAWLAAYER
jgi:hypothetical protein